MEINKDETILKYCNNLSFVIIEFLFVVFLISNIGFLFKISITWFYLIFAALVVFFSLQKLNSKWMDCCFQFLIFLFLIFISFFYITNKGDCSYDGLAYHFQGMFYLKHGWNPIYCDATTFGEAYYLQYANNLWVQVWPKFCEIVSSCFYKLTNIMEAGFIINCLTCYAVFVLAFAKNLFLDLTIYKYAYIL